MSTPTNESSDVSTASATATANTPVTTDEIIDVMRGLIGDVIGEEYIVGLDIAADTTFSTDLEMESIEFVALAEAIQDHYGEEVDFVAWIAEMELDDLIEMTVGSVAEFVRSCIDQRGTDG